MTKPRVTKNEVWESRVVGHGEVDPRTLTPNPDNWRTHPERQQAALVGAMNEIGWVSPVIVNKQSNNLIDGHLRLALALTKRQGKIPVTYVDLSPEEERMALASLDPLSMMAGTDPEALERVLADLMPQDQEFAKLLEALGTAAGVGDETPVEEVNDETLDYLNKWPVEFGDIWIAGDHRLACGDSTDRTVYERLLLPGERAQVIVTDPPYGVEYHGGPGRLRESIAGDELTGEALIDFLAVSFARMAENAHNDAAFYIWHASSTRAEFTDAMRRAGLEERQYLMWIKHTTTFGRSHYQHQAEPCFYAAKSGETALFVGDRKQTTVWEFGRRTSAGASTVLGRGLVLSDGQGNQLHIQPRPPKGKKLRTEQLLDGQTIEIGTPGDTADAWYVQRDSSKYMHPTQKPVGLTSRALRNSTNPGDIMLDPFAGTGASAVACEQMHRVARVIDFKPSYIAVALDRLAELGLKPTKE